MPLDPDRWRAVERLFGRAVDLDPEARRDLLDRECGDEGVRREVERLLAHDRGSTSRVAEPIREARSNAESAKTIERIGPYRIVRELGQGGMGMVLLAERDDQQYSKQVAIKLVRAGVDSDALLQRFRAERQILASLEHGNIARLLDGGVTDDGQPYLVMEYVEGEPIDAYCDRLRLGVDARLQIFRSVCIAVQHAHRNLIVHRDIKPANILVTAGGDPKLVDFGIAKLLDVEVVAPTLTAARMMTPEYASPEQVRGEPITTASDIYSLGVLLYELLTGRRPYRLASRRIGDMARAITEQEPERPSTAVSREPAESDPGGLTTTADRLSSARSTLPAELRRRLAGDLDDIVLMTLRKEPERRYASAFELSEDIRRHLEGLPVAARKDTLRYRAAKFARRNPWGVAAIAAILLIIIGSSGGFWLQARRIAGERDRAIAAEEAARTETATAQRVTDFLVDLFEYSDPAEARGRDVPVREVLERGARRVQGELGDEPEVQARLLTTIAQVYSSLGLFDEALTQARAALEKERMLRGEASPEVARLRTQVGGLLGQLGKHGEAEKEILAGLEAQRRMLGPDHDDIVTSLNTLGNLRDAQGRYGEAEEHHRAALDMAKRLHGERHLLVGKAANNLGRTLNRRGALEESERVHRANLEMLRDLLGDDHPNVETSMNNLGLVLTSLGRFEEAEGLLREVVELSGRLSGKDSFSYALALNNLAVVLKEQGRPAEAVPLQLEAIDILTRQLGPEHPQTVARTNNLANLYHDMGNLEEAERLHRRVLEINRRTLGQRHPETIGSLNNLANLLWDAGRFDEAEPIAREVLAADIETLGPDHQYVAYDYTNLGVILRDRGRAADRREAETMFAKGVEAARKAFGAVHPGVATNEAHYGIFLARTGRVDEGERRVREALRIYEEAHEEGHFQIDMARGMLGECLAIRGRFEEAETLILGAYEALRDKLGDNAGVTRRTRARAARLYEAWGRREKAAAYRKKGGRNGSGPP